MPNYYSDGTQVGGGSNHEFNYTGTDMTASFEDGYYIGYYTSGGAYAKGTGEQFSAVTISGINELDLYKFSCYYDPLTQPLGQVVWKNEFGDKIKDNLVIPFNKLVKVDKKGDYFYDQFVLAPLGAVTAEITVPLAEKANCVFQKVSVILADTDWSSVKFLNFTDSDLEELGFRLSYIEENDLPKYRSYVDKSYDIHAKKIILFGDSIAVGYGASSTAKTWWSIFKDRFSAASGSSNEAVSGSTIADPSSSSSSISAKVLNYNGDADVIIIAGGTNDHTSKYSLGKFGDTTVSTFYGALYAMCEHLRTLSASKIVFITPINKTGEYDNQTSLNKYRDAIHEVAIQYGFSVIEGAEFAFPSVINYMSKALLGDGLHPSDTGYMLYANEVCYRI